jgi:hypothetical protein
MQIDSFGEGTTAYSCNGPQNRPTVDRDRRRGRHEFRVAGASFETPSG